MVGVAQVAIVLIVRRLHHFYRFLRKATLYALEPVDVLARLINNKRGYPPLALRRQNGPLNAFERVAGEYSAYLVTLAGMSPKSRILDVGCGSGAMSFVIDERLTSGEYVGLEVDASAATWCARNLEDHRHTFHRYNYWNATYNPKGLRDCRWPVEDQWADVVLLKSVFTHMLPDDVSFYLEEIARTLSNDGRALVTAFLLDENVGEDAGHQFPHVSRNYSYSLAASPESAIALDAAWFHAQVDRVGLKGTLYPGLWRGEQVGFPYAYQDMIVLAGDVA